MRILIMGSGGVGGYFGARLARGGADVFFIARGAHLQAMQERGLSIEGTDESFHLPEVNAADDPAQVGPVDLVLFCVKLWDSELAAHLITPAVGAHTVVISLQNGVQKDDLLVAKFGADRVMGGVAYMATNVSRPGVIAQTGAMQRLLFGEFDGTQSKRASAFLDAAKRGGINAEVTGDVRRAIWEKFVFLVGLSGATTVMREHLGPIRANPRSRQFLFDLTRETVEVGRAMGIALPADYAEQRMAFADTLPYAMTSSMHHDLEHGSPLELRWLSGAVMELGSRVGVATPANRAVNDILVLHADGRKPKSNDNA
jgi:2-dehydropantoate 2-reductase